MKPRWQVARPFLPAVALPLLVAAFSWFVHDYISAANIALFYISVVILVAINAGMRPAMVAAVCSFLAFNFTYTEPRGTFFVDQRQDLLMLVLFLLIALIVGRLAANLREQLERLRTREALSRMELGFMQKLSAAVSTPEIIEVVRVALASIMNLKYRLILCHNGEVNWSEKEHLEQATLRQQINEQLRDGRALRQPELNSDTMTLLFLGDGQLVQAVLVVLPSPDDTGNLARLMGRQAILALTRTRLAAELENEKLARESETLRSSLLSSLSHDFKTPLTSMIGASSTLLELGDNLNREQQRELLDAIQSEAQRLASFTQNLLDLSQLDEGALALNRSTVTIEEILHPVLKRLHQHRQCTIEVDIAPGLPALDVHAALIEQALYNVLDNACKFSPADRPVRLRCNAIADRLTITVEDAGPGIPVAERDKVFELFHSADRGDRRAAGSGLGLAICKGMIGTHGGSVSIADSPDLGGCLVRISLPTHADGHPGSAR